MQPVVRDLTIGWYIPTQTVCPQALADTDAVLQEALSALQAKRGSGSVEPAAVFMGIGRDTLRRIVARGYAWQAGDAPTVDTAMQFALDVLLSCDADTQQRAGLKVHNLERM